MTITAYNTTRNGTATVVTVTSSLSGTIYYHWYLDGAYLASTNSPTMLIDVPVGEQAVVDVIDTNDADYDPIANAPAGYPARRTIVWNASPESDTEEYRVYYRASGDADWTLEATLPITPGAWQYTHLTLRLTDLESYSWQIIPYDRAGNAGTAIEIGPEKIVRTPDAPDFDIAYDADTDLITWSDAA